MSGCLSNFITSAISGEIIAATRSVMIPANTATIRAYTGHFGLHDPVATTQLLDMGHRAKALKNPLVSHPE
jgi:hypothetical protein